MTEIKEKQKEVMTLENPKILEQFLLEILDLQSVKINSRSTFQNMVTLMKSDSYGEIVTKHNTKDVLFSNLKHQMVHKMLVRKTKPHLKDKKLESTWLEIRKAFKKETLSLLEIYPTLQMKKLSEQHLRAQEMLQEFIFHQTKMVDQKDSLLLTLNQKKLSQKLKN